MMFKFLSRVGVSSLTDRQHGFSSHGNPGAEPAHDSTETESNIALGRFQGDEHSRAGSRTAPSVHVFRSEELTVMG